MLTSPVLFLNFFGTSEFLIIGVAVIFLFGPKKLPELARNFGQFMRKVKDAQSNIVGEIKQGASGFEDEALTIHKQVTKTKKEIESIKNQVNEDINKATQSIPRKS
ncbi:MAG: Sec-independent protein translocase subunit TatA/TatB [Flavobacteriales bacterium]